jgi:small GTP-binding protein
MFIGAIVVFDTTDAETFKKMGQWVKELKSYLPNEIPIIIAGNKADLGSKAIDDEQVKAFARQNTSQYFPTSAKTGLNVEEAFVALA